MRRFFFILSVLALVSSLAMAQDSPAPDPSVITKEAMAEYAKLKEAGDDEGQIALVNRISTARLAKNLAFLGSRTALFPKEIARLERQLKSVVGLVLSEGDKPDVYAQSAQWKWANVGIIALALLVDYDCRFIDSGFRISDFKMISYSMGEGYFEQTQKCCIELWNARKDLLYAVSSPLLRMTSVNSSSVKEGLTELSNKVDKQITVLEDKAAAPKDRITAVILLRKSFQGIRTFKANPEDLAKRFPEGSEEGAMFASMAAKEKGYLTDLLAIVKAKDSDAELKLAAASAWASLESAAMTKAQVAEVKADKFRGVAIPELSRYATLPSMAPSPLIEMEEE